MLRIRIDDKYFDLGAKAKIRFQLKNPLLSDETIGGEYSFPFTVELTDSIAELIEYKSEILAEGFFVDKLEAMLYDDDLLLYKGFLNIDSVDEKVADLDFQVSSSILSTIKNKKLSEFDYGEIDARINYQFIEIFVPDSFRGLALILRYGIGGYTEPVPTTVDAALDLVEAWVATNQYLGIYNVTTSRPAANTIRFTATWVGANPKLEIIFETISMPSPPSVTINDSLQGNALYDVDMKAHMTLKAGQSYPTAAYTFFPVVNGNAGIFVNDLDFLGEYNPYFQNLFEANLGDWNPRGSHIDPGTAGEVEQGCVTPFMYLAYVLDKIAASLNLRATGFIHNDTDMKKMVVWNNRFMDNTTYFVADNKLAQLKELKYFLPELTIEEFFSLLKSTLCIGYIVDQYTNFKIVDLQSLIDVDSTTFLDWTSKEVSKQKIFAGNSFAGYALKYQLDKNDSLSLQQETNFEKLVYVGEFPTVADLPDYKSPVQFTSYYYAYVIDINSFYLLSYLGFGVYQWDPIVDPQPNYVVQLREGDVTDFFAHDTLAMVKGAISYNPSPTPWKLPFANQNLNYFLTNRNSKTCGLRLLMYHGYRNDDNGDPYPFGSSDGVDYDGNSVSDISLRWQGPKGLYPVRWKKWFKFLETRKPIEKYFNVTELDLLMLKYENGIYCNGANYLIDEIQVERPITGSTLFKLWKIESSNG